MGIGYTELVRELECLSKGNEIELPSLIDITVRRCRTVLQSGSDAGEKEVLRSTENDS